jgi:glycosyltransferase involved in cell wall biosynthesis
MEHVPGAHLAFLGDDGEPGFTASLERLAVAEGLRDRVHFVPGAPLERLLALTAEADVGVSLLQDTCENHRLALPNKVFEYIAAGLPVVVSDLPELRRLVEEHGIGWTAPPGDPVAVSDGLRSALSARGDDERLAAVRRVAGAFTWDAERERLLGLYARLAGTVPVAVV